MAAVDLVWRAGRHGSSVPGATGPSDGSFHLRRTSIPVLQPAPPSPPPFVPMPLLNQGTTEYPSFKLVIVPSDELQRNNLELENFGAEQPGAAEDKIKVNQENIKLSK